MSVRKRRWKTGDSEKEAWIVDYVDQSGARRLKTFSRKKEADAFAAVAHVEVRDGIHVADSASATVKQAGDLWIVSGEARGLERATVDQYRQHLELHIAPFIGAVFLSRLNAPAVREFEDKLRQRGARRPDAARQECCTERRAFGRPP